MSVTAAAEKYGIPKSTVSCEVSGKNLSAYGHPTVFSSKEEVTIAKHVYTVADWGFPMNMFDLQMLGKLYLDQRGRKVSNFKNNLPGKEWARGLMRRHGALITTRLCQNIKVIRSKVDAVNKY